LQLLNFFNLKNLILVGKRTAGFHWLELSSIRHFVACVALDGNPALVCNVVGRINEVNRRRARLVLGWVTISVCNHMQPTRPTQPGHPTVGGCNE